MKNKKLSKSPQNIGIPNQKFHLFFTKSQKITRSYSKKKKSNLPNTLIEGFKTTLESALEADLLLMVCDVSDPNMEKQIKVTQTVLEELGLKDKDRIFVFNKTDLVQNKFKLRLVKRNYPDSFLVSSFDKKDVNELRSHVISYFLNKQNHFDLFIPYQDGEAHSEVMGHTNVINQENYENGIFYRVKTPDFIFYRLGIKKYILGPEQANVYLNDQLDSD